MLKYSVSSLRDHFNDEDMYIARLQSGGTMSLEEFAEHVTAHGTVYHKGDIMAVLVLVARCLHEELLEGMRVNLGDLGTFYLGSKSKKTSTSAEFTDDNITALQVRFEPSELFDHLREEASFCRVVTEAEMREVDRAAKLGYSQADLLKKAGIDLDDLTASASATEDKTADNS